VTTKAPLGNGKLRERWVQNHSDDDTPADDECQRVAAADLDAVSRAVLQAVIDVQGDDKRRSPKAGEIRDRAEQLLPLDSRGTAFSARDGGDYAGIADQARALQKAGLVQIDVGLPTPARPGDPAHTRNGEVSIRVTAKGRSVAADLAR
jgi:hypothetical protein